MLFPVRSPFFVLRIQPLGDLRNAFFGKCKGLVLPAFIRGFFETVRAGKYPGFEYIGFVFGCFFDIIAHAVYAACVWRFLVERDME